MIDNGRTGGSMGTCEELMAGDEDGERAVASAEDQLREEMTVYEVHALYGCILICFHFPSRALFQREIKTHKHIVFVLHAAEVTLVLIAEIYYGDAHQFWQHGIGPNS